MAQRGDPAVDLYICPICGKTFSKSSSLTQHIVRAHGSYKLIVDAGKFITRLEKLERTLQKLAQGLAALQEKVQEIQQSLTQLTEVLGKVQKLIEEGSQVEYTYVVQVRRIAGSGGGTPQVQVPALVPYTVNSVSEPDFLSDNPWVQVLMRRGQEPPPPQY